MFAPSIDSYRPNQLVNARRVAPLRAYLKPGTLAIALIVAVAITTSTRGKVSGDKASAPSETNHAEIFLKNLRFSPETLSVPVGTTVTFINQDDRPRSVMSMDSWVRTPRVLETGDRFSQKFALAGTYSFFCALDPTVTEEIVVR